MNHSLAIDYRGLGRLPLRPLPTEICRPGPVRLEPHLRAHEIQMVRLLAQGYTLKETAAWIGVTYGTARVYIENARKHIGARTTAQMVAWYVKGE